MRLYIAEELSISTFFIELTIIYLIIEQLYISMIKSSDGIIIAKKAASTTANGGRLKILALYEAHSLIVIVPQATLTFGQCALGFAQVKTAGLVEVFDLIVPTFYRVSHFTLSVLIAQVQQYCQPRQWDVSQQPDYRSVV